MSTQENFLTQLVEQFKNGAISQKAFMKAINATPSAPTVKQEKNLKKTVKANRTRQLNKMKKTMTAVQLKANKHIVEGNALIQKMNMNYDMQAMNKLQSNIKAHSKITFGKPRN